MLEEVRSQTEKLVQNAVDSESPVLIESPPASGKTWNAVQLAVKSDYKVTYLAGRTDLYEQALETAQRDTDLNVETIPSPHRDCPTFLGDNDGATNTVHRLYQKGVRARDLHFEGWDKVHTPCQTPEDSCPYIETLDDILPENGLDEIDLLIGNHQHAYRDSYLRDRIVIFDEFNPDPFVRRYPSEDETVDIRDTPGEVVSEFLETVEGLPFDDITDLIEARIADEQQVDQAIEWFEEQGADSKAGKQIMTPSSRQYDASHTASPLLALSLLTAEKIGPGIEIARDDEIWERVDIDEGTRCLRDRNTNEMLVLNPPSLEAAEQVIGMDALPTKKLWDTVFGTSFNLKQVLDRKELDRYLSEGLNFNLIQLADGMNHYSGGYISKRDKERFEAVRIIEGERFPLITRKKALERYRNYTWFEESIKLLSQIDGIEAPSSDEDPYAGQHYATVLSSNKFETECLGAVSGSPYPSDDIIKKWAGLCGEPTEPIRTNGTLEGFEGFGNRVYKHFTHHQVFQAILRFGRDIPESEDDEVTVYVNTCAVPEWLDSIKELDIKKRISEPKRAVVLEELIRAKRSHESFDQQTVSTIQEAANQTLKTDPPRDSITEISEKHVRDTLQSEQFDDVISIESNGGTGGADLYNWVGESNTHQRERSNPVDSLLLLESTAYFLKLNR